MIEVNLSPVKKSGGLTNIAGIDLSLINVKMLFIAMLIFTFPDGFLLNYYESEIQKNQNAFEKLNKEFKSLNQRSRALVNIKKQVDALDEQEKKLALKLEAVKKIINKRSNPVEILDYVAKNIPSDVWLTDIKLEGVNLIMSGHSESWKSIGSFLENLKNSIFFSKDISYSRPENGEKEFRGRRVEIFEIKASVVRFH